MSVSTGSATGTATARTFMLPDLGEGLTEAEVIEWHVAPGDEVHVDQIVVTVETAKATVDLPCPYAGPVLTLHGEPGAVLEVGRPLLTIGAEQKINAELKTSAQDTSGAELSVCELLVFALSWVELPRVEQSGPIQRCRWRPADPRR